MPLHPKKKVKLPEKDTTENNTITPKDDATRLENNVICPKTMINIPKTVLKQTKSIIK